MSTPDKQAAPSEWVEEAMRLSAEGADAAWDAGAAGPYESMQAPHAKKRDDKQAALRAHLESREALVKQLAEALEELHYAHTDKADELARAALAVWRQYVATQEKT